MKATREEVLELAEYAFSSENPGFKPNVQESPNGDGTFDEAKKYAHLAPKYFDQAQAAGFNIPSHAIDMYWRGWKEAKRVCKELGLPEDFMPGSDSTLRVLKYPPGATTAPHTDFDLFTLSMYRSHPAAFRYLGGSDKDLHLLRARGLSPGLHLGELYEELRGFPATKHEVVATEDDQLAMVFFVLPDHRTVLPATGERVGDWVAERYARSRRG